jgi:hypothetical protein
MQSRGGGSLPESDVTEPLEPASVVCPPALPVALANFSSPAVMVIGRDEKSVSPNVTTSVVVTPFSSPTYVQTASVKTLLVQSRVIATLPVADAPLALSAASAATVVTARSVEGPSVNVTAPGKPHSLESVPGGHWIARTFAVGLDSTTEATSVWSSMAKAQMEVTELDWAMAQLAKRRRAAETEMYILQER